LSNTTYYLAWLAAGLFATAIASALIARHLRLRALRRLKAPQLLDALARYSGWAAAQRHAMLFQADAWGGDEALAQVRGLQRQWFAPLAREAAQLLDTHTRLVEFLWTQQVLRLSDAEAWLLSDPDAKFMALWQPHHEAVRALGDKLQQLAGVADAGCDAGWDAGWTSPA
jgi:hypothetical protein